MTVDRVLGIAALVLALVAGVFAWRFGLGSLNAPGAGAWPLLIGLTMAVLGAVLALRPDRDRPDPVEGQSHWKGFWGALLSMVLFIPALVALGYPVAMWGVLLVQLRWVEGRSWTTAFMVATVAAGGSFGVFRMLLHVPLPAGIVPMPSTW